MGLSDIKVSSTCISQSCGDTGTAVFCNSFVCDGSYGLYMLSFLNLDLESVIKD